MRITDLIKSRREADNKVAKIGQQMSGGGGSTIPALSFINGVNQISSGGLSVAPFIKMFNDGITDYNFGVQSTTGWVAVQDSLGVITIHHAGDAMFVSGTNPFCVLWSCLSATNPSHSGNLTTNDLGNGDFGDLIITNIIITDTLIYDLQLGGSSIVSLDLSGLDHLLSIAVSGSITLTSINLEKAKQLQFIATDGTSIGPTVDFSSNLALQTLIHGNATAAITINLTGLRWLSTVYFTNDSNLTTIIANSLPSMRNFTALNCFLSQSTVDLVLGLLVQNNQRNGNVQLNGGTSSAPSAAGLANKATLLSRGWFCTTN